MILVGGSVCVYSFEKLNKILQVKSAYTYTLNNKRQKKYMRMYHM